MALTKTYTTATWASGSATASGTTNTVSTTGCYAACWYIKMVVVGTPTSGNTFIVQQSPDGSTLYNGPTFQMPWVAGTYYWIIALDATCELTDIVYVAQSGGTSSTPYRPARRSDGGVACPYGQDGRPNRRHRRRSTGRTRQPGYHLRSAIRRRRWASGCAGSPAPRARSRRAATMAPGSRRLTGSPYIPPLAQNGAATGRRSIHRTSRFWRSSHQRILLVPTLSVAVLPATSHGAWDARLAAAMGGCGYTAVDSSVRITSSTPMPSDGSWHTIVGTADSAHLNFYFDGALNAQATFSGALPSNTTTVTIGAGGYANAWANSSVALVRIWNRALHTLGSRVDHRQPLADLRPSVVLLADRGGERRGWRSQPEYPHCAGHRLQRDTDGVSLITGPLAVAATAYVGSQTAGPSPGVAAVVATGYVGSQSSTVSTSTGAVLATGYVGRRQRDHRLASQPLRQQGTSGQRARQSRSAQPRWSLPATPGCNRPRYRPAWPAWRRRLMSFDAGSRHHRGPGNRCDWICRLDHGCGGR